MTDAVGEERSGKTDGSFLYGGWKIVSTVVHTEGEGVVDVPSEGYLVFTPAHRVSAIVGRPGRRPAANEAEELALARSLMAYTGRFDLFEDHFVVHLEMSSTQLALDEPQPRYFVIDGDMLTIRTPMRNSVIARGKRESTTLTAVRETRTA